MQWSVTQVEIFCEIVKLYTFNLFLLVEKSNKNALNFRCVAGLNAARAKKIVDWREKNGPFQCREQLKTVTGIGPKTYEQCAGFVRVLPETRTSVENG